MDEVAFGRYRLIALIGEGGMGKVYRAHDSVMGRDVAVKVLPVELATEPGYEQRFRREAATAARLSEPHIIPIFEAGEIEGRLYLVMPIVDGVDVQTLLQRDGPMSPQRAVQVIEQLAAALNVAHRHGLVHRDIKPSNALVTGDDFVYLIDFGLAHDGAATRLTSTGMMVGTLAYMAPERFTAGIADARADVYALACVLYECLTGDHPYPGESLEQQIAGHLTVDPPRPSERRPDVAAGLDEVIATGMAKKPEQRYQSARELAIAARHALTGVPTPARAARTAPAAVQADDAVLSPPPPPFGDRLPPPPPPEPGSAQSTVRLRQSGQGRPGLIAAIVVVGVILVAAGVIGYLLQSHSPGSKTPAAQPALSSEPTADPSSEQTAQPAPPSQTTAPPAQVASTPYVQLPGIAGCEVAADSVVCEGTWPQAPVTPCTQCTEVMHMDQALVDANGNLTWRDANIGDPDAGPGWFVLTVGQPYHGYGWTAQSDGSGHTTFTNDATGHGMTITWVAARDASHAEVSTF